MGLCCGNTSLPRLRGAQSTRKAREALCPPRSLLVSRGSEDVNTNLHPNSSELRLLLSKEDNSQRIFVEGGARKRRGLREVLSKRQELCC